MKTACTPLGANRLFFKYQYDLQVLVSGTGGAASRCDKRKTDSK